MADRFLLYTYESLETRSLSPIHGSSASCPLYLRRLESNEQVTQANGGSITYRCDGLLYCACGRRCGDAARARVGFASRIWEGNCMAKTNSKGYFCDVPCGFMNAACENFFCAGCAAAGMPLPPNTEYTDVKKMHRGEDGDHHEVI